MWGRNRKKNRKNKLERYRVATCWMLKGDFVVAIFTSVGQSDGHWLGLSGVGNARKTSEPTVFVFTYGQVGMPRYLLRGGKFLTEWCNDVDYGTFQESDCLRHYRCLSCQHSWVSYGPSKGMNTFRLVWTSCTLLEWSFHTWPIM